MIDIDKVKLANESAIAVGNMKVNARGDKLGPGGQVVAGRNQIMDQVYNVPVAPSAGYSPNDPGIHADTQAIIEANQAAETQALAQTLSAPVSPETNTPSAPAARGSLANSVKKSK